MDILILTLFYLFFFFFVYKLYYWLRGRKNKEALFKVVEILYLSGVYKLNIKKIGIKKMLNIVALTNALIFTITLVVTESVTNTMLRLLIMFVILFPLIYLAYLGIGKYYQKKGMITHVRVPKN